jgi:hypothetical protein
MVVTQHGVSLRIFRYSANINETSKVIQVLENDLDAIWPTVQWRESSSSSISSSEEKWLSSAIE